jgi:predicted RNA binding protein YcfA (HicA-like mRNA interferase family)
MTSVPELSYREIVQALQKDGWVSCRTRNGRFLETSQVDQRGII